MKKSIADKIEQYVKVLIESSGRGQIEIQRIELAETFCCVPSQITYVLSTRFTEENGYITESRRGGKGFVRVMRRAKAFDEPYFVDMCQVKKILHEKLAAGLMNEREFALFNSFIENASLYLAEDGAQKMWKALYQAISKWDAGE